MNLAYKYPIIFWDTANLIVDSGAMNLKDEIDLDEDSDENDEESDDQKVKNSSTDYGKIASAIGKMKSRGLSFSLPNINKSDITFSPDLETNTILYGLRGITRIGNQLIKDIIKNRPYSSIEDFLSKIKINKTQMINLLKAGAFDSLYNVDRTAIVERYLNLISDKKKRITLQNMQMLITKDMIPAEYQFEVKLFNFNKYLKNFKKDDYYILDEIALKFYLDNYDESNLENMKVNNDSAEAAIKQSTWDNIYKKGMNPIRDWMKVKQKEILDKLNNSLYLETKEKYAVGSISKWEMDSLSFYYHDHELANLKNEAYDITDYFKLPNEPKIDKSFEDKKGNTITIYKLSRIAGTVIDKDKNKSTVTLLTTSGVVVVKVWKSQFSTWDKTIFEKDYDGTKRIIEKSWFQRGTKLIITGLKREDSFIPKKYSNTPYPLFEKIEEMDNDGFILKSVTERTTIDE